MCEVFVDFILFRCGESEGKYSLLPPVPRKLISLPPAMDWPRRRVHILVTSDAGSAAHQLGADQQAMQLARGTNHCGASLWTS